MSTKSTTSHHSRRSDTPPPTTGTSEKDVLVGFLDYLRHSACSKVEGLSETVARSSAVPSGTNLLGLLWHLTNVERAMFLQEKITKWPSTFTAPKSHTVDSVVAAYRESTARANAVIDTYTDLGLPAPIPPGRSSGPAMRWALTHMIEETGRHAGHLDIIREMYDGSTGR